MTESELKGLLEHGSSSFKRANQTSGETLRKRDKPKRENALVAEAKGTETGLHRPTIRFTGYRVRPLDPDNFCGRGIKNLLDGLRHADLISGDEPWKIILQTEQVKVSTKSQERTEIEIIYPCREPI